MEQKYSQRLQEECSRQVRARGGRKIKQRIDGECFAVTRKIDGH